MECYIDAIGLAVAILSVLVLVLVCVQVYNSVEINRRSYRLEKEFDELKRKVDGVELDYTIGRIDELINSGEKESIIEATEIWRKYKNFKF